MIEEEADDAEVRFVVVEIGILQEQSKGAARRPFLRGIQSLGTPAKG